METPWVLAHISDFHSSTYGETFHDRTHMIKRGLNAVAISKDKYELKTEIKGWQVLLQRSTKLKDDNREKLLLVDPQGYEHPIPEPSKSTKHDSSEDIIHRATEYALAREARSYKTLSNKLPSDEEVQTMLINTPTNTNLRLIRAARMVMAKNPEILLITGDLTDHGAGYELIERLFEPWKKAGRLLAVPGNHDLYLFPFGGTTRPKPTHESKRKAWQAFAQRIELKLDKTGAWVKEFPECQTIIVGLDSCAMGQSRFMLHSGAIGKAQLNFLRGVAGTSGWRNARHRIVAMHHHLVPLPLGVGKGAPTEIGMRLDDAPEVATILNQVDATFVVHGHRHISEARQPAGCNFQLLSAPSLTLGCRSGDVPSYWRIELGAHARWERVRLTFPSLDPSLDVPNLVEV